MEEPAKVFSSYSLDHRFYLLFKPETRQKTLSSSHSLLKPPEICHTIQDPPLYLPYWTNHQRNLFVLPITARKREKMCFSAEPKTKTKYYYHEEIIPSRRHSHHHHGHHHHSSHSPRASYTSVRRSYQHSPRASGQVVYERTSQSRYV